MSSAVRNSRLDNERINADNGAHTMRCQCGASEMLKSRSDLR